MAYTLYYVICIGDCAQIAFTDGDGMAVPMQAICPVMRLFDYKFALRDYIVSDSMRLISACYRRGAIGGGVILKSALMALYTLVI